MTPTSRVMLFIDADNVSADVIGQAIAKVKADHGAIHVRRAHCTPEVALKHAKLFKSLSIRPIVNLASGKNSTDIALAVDAMEMVCAERPNLVVIVSSDSDFAPLVIRLREKGCRVCGIGQRGKTGDEVVEVYDEFIDLEHRKAPPSPKAPPPRSRGGRAERPAAAREPARAAGGAQGRGAQAERPAGPREQERGDGRAAGRGARRPSDRGSERAADRFVDDPLDRPTDHEIDRAMGWPPVERSVDRGERPSPERGRGRGRREAAPADEPDAEPLVEPVVEATLEAAVAAPVEDDPVPAKRASSRRPRGGKAAREAAAVPVAAAIAPAAAPVPPPMPAPATPLPPVLAAPVPPPLSAATLAALAESGLPSDVQRLLEAIPELLGGGVFELSHAAERLRTIGLLAKNAPSTKLFKKYPDLFVLTPGRQPNKVRFSGPAVA